MKRRILYLIVSVFLLTGCSTIALLPVKEPEPIKIPVTMNATITGISIFTSTNNMTYTHAVTDTAGITLYKLKSEKEGGE